MIDAAGTLAHTTLQVAGALGGTVDQEYLFEARQMQAMSFAFHIILVCFGVALPAIVVFMEGLWLRTGDPLYRTLAQRWSKAMIALFAIGVVSGTILSFELGMLWPEFMATFGSVFGLGFALEGFSFFIEAIFITIYVYSWGRLPPKVHFLTGLPIIVTGITGSYFVLSVNGWMNNPSGFDLLDGQVTNVDPLAGLITVNSIYELVHMTIAAYMVVGFVVAGIYAWGWLRGRRDRYHRVGFVVAFTVAALAAPVQLLVGDWAAREVAIHQPVKLAAMEGLSETTAGRRSPSAGWYSDGELKGGVEIPKLLSLLAHHDPELHGHGARHRSRRRPAAGERGAPGVPRDGGNRQRPGPLGAVVPAELAAPSPAAAFEVVLPGRGHRGPRGDHRPRGRLGDHRGGPPAVDRL